MFDNIVISIFHDLAAAAIRTRTRLNLVTKAMGFNLRSNILDHLGPFGSFKTI